MRNYLYSIVIPHYNSPTLLQRMLDSIPQREDIQIIVIDDCSSNENIKKLQLCHHTNLEIEVDANFGMISIYTYTKRVIKIIINVRFFIHIENDFVVRSFRDK